MATQWVSLASRLSSRFECFWQSVGGNARFQIRTWGVSSRPLLFETYRLRLREQWQARP